MQFTVPADSIAGAFGDGSDGDVVLANGSVTTLTRDMKYRNLTLIAASGTATIHTAGFIIQVAQKLTVGSGVSIADILTIDNNATDNTPGAQGTLYGGAAAPVGASTPGNVPAANALAGVIGGGSGGPSAAIKGGQITPSGLIIPGQDLIDAILEGGASGATGATGLGGAGGGVVMLIANQIQIGQLSSLNINARGGARTVTGISGDGGGGVIVIASANTISGPLTTDVTSTGFGEVTGAGNGLPGKVFNIPIAT